MRSIILWLGNVIDWELLPWYKAVICNIWVYQHVAMCTVWWGDMCLGLFIYICIYYYFPNSKSYMSQNVCVSRSVFIPLYNILILCYIRNKMMYYSIAILCLEQMKPHIVRFYHICTHVFSAQPKVLSILRMKNSSLSPGN